MSTKVSKLPVVGYRKPPVHSRFRKGQSGNPGGRPKGMTSGRAAALMQKEVYRRIRVKEGDKVVTMTVFQAVLRSLITLAMKGNSGAQRAFLDLVRAIERESAGAQSATEVQEILIRFSPDDEGLL